MINELTCQLVTNCNYQNQSDFLTKKVKNLDKRNFHSRETFGGVFPFGTQWNVNNCLFVNQWA